MRSFAIGCVCAIVGLVIGVALAAGVFSFSNRAAAQIPTPIPNASAVSVTASATYLDSVVQQAARQSGMLRNATVTLESPNIVKVAATVDVTVLGQRVNANATATMRVSVKNNRIALVIEKIDAGTLPVPQSLITSNLESLRAQAENQINTLVQRSLQGTNLRLSNIRITPAELIVDLASP